MQFLVTFGVDMGQSKSFTLHREGYVGVVDWDTKDVQRMTHFTPSRPEGFPVETWRFGGASYHKGMLYTCTFLEALAIDVATWELAHVVSEPWFNDIHHVYANDRHVLVVNTGLERVEIYDHSWNHLGFYNLLDVDTWERFDRDTDYRLVPSPGHKPDKWQANYITEIDGQYWATRFGNMDVINLDDPTQRFDIGVGNPHDGHCDGEYIYYTTTNNHIVIVDRASKVIADIVDLQALNGRKERIGWCRGLEIVGRYAFVGFSRFRQSKFRAMGHWIKRGQRILPSQILQVDLRRREIVDRCVIRTDPGCTIFSIIDMQRLNPVGETGAPPNRVC